MITGKLIVTFYFKFPYDIVHSTTNPIQLKIVLINRLGNLKFPYSGDVRGDKGRE